MPVSKAPYKRKYHHVGGRGSESTVVCGFCGCIVPRYKTMPTYRGFRITDPIILKAMVDRHALMSATKVYACPKCARHRRIVVIKRNKRKMRR